MQIAKFGGSFLGKECGKLLIKIIRTCNIQRIIDKFKRGLATYKIVGLIKSFSTGALYDRSKLTYLFQWMGHGLRML